MALFFGTDGLRGEVDKFLNTKIAFRCGNALANVYKDNALIKKHKCKILLGTDTRGSADMLATAFMSGAISAGANVDFVGVCPTAGIGYLTTFMGYDYGVVISASHNPAKFNGIKIFNKYGNKIDETQIKQVEKNMLSIKINKNNNFVKLSANENLKANYEAFLINATTKNLSTKTPKNLKVVLDSSNGAASKIAPKIFRMLGADVIETYSKPNGKNINKNCGSLNIDVLKANVLKHGADVGFAFDGDSDRVIAVAENGEVIDGDQIVYILACFYKENEMLNNNGIVCTTHTNFGIEKALQEKGICVKRTQVGDKFVSEELDASGFVVGGEQSGHIFMKDKIQTGDGILTALMLSVIMLQKDQKISTLMCDKIIPQINKNIEVKNKEKIIENQNLKHELEKLKDEFNDGRLFVRASGTENVVRIMAENENKEKLNFVADALEKMIREIDLKGGLCVE